MIICGKLLKGRVIKIDPKLMKYFKNHEYGPEIIMISLYMKGRYSLSYREIEEIGGLRGVNIDHATLQRWVIKWFCRIWKRGVNFFKLFVYFSIKQLVKEIYQSQNYNYHCQQVVLF